MASGASALTTRQLEILAFIRERHTSQGTPPSIREIGDAFGINSTNGVSDHLRALVRKGALRRIPRQARGYVPAAHSSAPWDGCKVGFGIDDAEALDDVLDVASVPGGAGLPMAWRLEEVDGTGARWVAVFSVAGIPSAEDGRAVLEWLRARGAA